MVLPSNQFSDESGAYGPHDRLHTRPRSQRIRGRPETAPHGALGDPQLPRDPLDLAKLIKRVSLPVKAVAPVERAISTTGGVALAGTDARLMLKALPGVFVTGEMLDWDAPTGGYLLTACLATGRAAAKGVLDWMEHGRT